MHMKIFAVDGEELFINYFDWTVFYYYRQISFILSSKSVYIQYFSYSTIGEWV